MNANRPPIGKLDLLAYVDGLLEPSRRADVEAYLASQPEEAAWVADCLKQNELLRELYDRPYQDPLPAPLRRTLDGRPAARTESPLRRIAAALVLLLGGGAAGWWLGQTDPFGTGVGDTFLREIAAAHAEARAAGGLELELAADVDLPALSWPAAAALPAGAPDLSAHGLALVNRRAVAAPNGGQAVQLIYEDVSGRLVSVYLEPGSPEPGPEFYVAKRAGLAVVYWLTGPVVHAVVGNLPEEEMAAVARSVRRSLTATGGATAPPAAVAGNGGNATLAPAAPVAPALVETESAGAADM